ncbi:MAG TPA: hypothetical protein VFG79_24325, partial [Solirubrobacter sp.]|nr:hypothetical protein [Solirubrobacter sp.]
TTLDVVGGAFAHNAMNRVDVTVSNGAQPAEGAVVTGDCGDGERTFGTTDAAGYLEVRVPHATCDFDVASGDLTAAADDFAVVGDKALSFSLASSDVGGDVPATLSLEIGPPAAFGAFVPGVEDTYEASTTANVISTAGDALLSVADPSDDHTGHLVNGEFFLPEPLQARARNAGNTGTAYNNVGSSLNLLQYEAPISNDAVSLQFSQKINANDALRTGSYSKTLTFTLSTTNP